MAAELGTGPTANLTRRVAREQQAREAAEVIAEQATSRFFEAVQATRRYRDLLDLSSDVVAVFRPDGHLFDGNAALRELAGGERSVGEIAVEDLVAPASLVTMRAVMSGAVPLPWTGELTLRDAAGEQVPVVAVVLGHRDDDDRLDRLSLVARPAPSAAGGPHRTVDEVTSLPTHAAFLDRLAEALVAGAGAESVAVLVVDVDDYRTVVETLGRETGDRLLVAMADRLRGAVPPGTTMARLDGAVFGVLVEAIDDVTVAWLGDAVLDALRRPFVVGGRSLVARPSVGLVRGRAGTAGTVLRDAEAALARAREQGGDRIVRFEEAIRTRAVERLELEQDLRRALHEDELVLEYQPEVRLADRSVVGFEALVRWRHPARGLVPPASFIPLAEATGLILPIGEWVLEQAAAQLVRFDHANPDRAPLFVAVNVSPRQVHDPGFPETVARVLEESGADPSRLFLELTESIFAGVDDRTREVLARLHRLGVKLVVDDFGAGYSTLRYVREFPIDVLKIDRAFIAELQPHSQDHAIVSALVSMADALGLVVVAEGIEDERQAALLSALGCQLAQGYLYGRPAPPVDAVD